MVVSHPALNRGNEKIGLFSDEANMGNLRYISSLEWTQGELVSFAWTVNGVPGRVVLAKSPRAADALARHTQGEAQTVVHGVAFAPDEDYYNFCQHPDAEGIPRDDE